MTADSAIRLTREHIESQFPKLCGKCGRRFTSLAEYLRQTTHVGEPMSFDVQMGDWRPQKPVGILSLANCPCGSTMALGSQGMKLLTLWRLMHWARGETKRRDVTMEQLLAWVRDQIDGQVLAEAQQRVPAS